MSNIQIQFPVSKIAWMGGTRPEPLIRLSKRERSLVSILFQEQIIIFTSGWDTFPELDICRTFWKRARYDAHATYRDRNRK